MEDDIEESMFDYLTDFELESVLPLYWLKCDKDEEALNKKLIDGYQMSDEWLQHEVRDIVMMNYEKMLDEKEFLGWVDWLDEQDIDRPKNEVDEKIFTDLWLISHLEDSVVLEKQDQVYRQNSSGLFLTVREADGQYVVNKSGCLWVVGGVLLIILLEVIFSS